MSLIESTFDLMSTKGVTNIGNSIIMNLPIFIHPYSGEGVYNPDKNIIKENAINK
jgi:hypothetical protein